MQPPPLPVNDFFALPTITLMITITFLMQASAIAFNSVMVKEYKGVKTVFLATISLALGFVILMLRSFLPESLVGLITNLFMIIGYTLIYIAICCFINRPFNRYLVHAETIFCQESFPSKSFVKFLTTPFNFIVQPFIYR